MASNLSKRLRDLDKKPKSAAKPSSKPFPGQRPDDNDDRPMDSVVFAMMSLTGLLLIVVLAVIFGTRSIDNGLENKIRDDLKSFEVTDVEVRSSAREVLVVGEVPREEMIDEVLAYLDTVPGVISHKVNIRVKVVRDPGEVTISADPIVLTWTPGGATVSGSASTRDVVDAIVLSLEETFGSVDSSGLTVKDGVASERDWLTAFLQLAAKMRQLNPTGSIFASPEQKLFQVAAEFDTRSERSDARQIAQDIVSATIFDFTSALTYKDAPPPPKEEQVIELQASIDQLIEDKIVEFETDSDVITPVGTALLDEILDALRAFPDVSIEIAGHTDDLGSDEYNDDLSRRRADAVLAYLVARGEAPDRFVVVGYGESRPIADNTTPEGRARNRRIEFKALLDG